jgi:hypothetical protein
MIRTTAEQKMHADIFFAARNDFEITIVHPIGHIICSYIERADTPTATPRKESYSWGKTLQPPASLCISLGPECTYTHH